MVRYNNLQALRTLAAVAVVILHVGVYAEIFFKSESALVGAMASPILGRSVCLFFVISGFVVTHSLHTTPPGRFIFLRFLRIFPAYWLAVVIAFAARAAVRFNRPPVDGNLLWGLCLLPGGSAASYILAVEWSLVFEVFFYAMLGLWAAVAGVARASDRRDSVARRLPGLDVGESGRRGVPPSRSATDRSVDPQHPVPTGRVGILRP